MIVEVLVKEKKRNYKEMPKMIEIKNGDSTRSKLESFIIWKEENIYIKVVLAPRH